MSDEETDRRREAALKRMLATPHKPHAATKGKASRAQSHKGNKVQPAKQRIQRQRGR
jgi:hypothetical protein